MRFQIFRISTAILAMVIISPMAQAVDITFDFRNLGNQSDYLLTSSGYSLVIDNPVNMGSQSGFFQTDFDGLWVGSVSIAPQIASFDMKVLSGGPLQFKSYLISYLYSSSTAGTFSLTGGTGTSTGNLLNPVGTYSFAGTKIINPGDVVTLNASFTSGSEVVSQIGSITFSTVPVPEPSTYALGGISVMTLGYLARRRRRIQSQKA